MGVLGVVALGVGACSSPATAPVDGFEIEVGDNFYKSNHAVTLPGETVTWRWTGSNQHNVTFDDPTIGNSATQTAGTFTRTFTPAPSGSSFTYYCTIHGRQAMSGIIEVR